MAGGGRGRDRARGGEGADRARGRRQAADRDSTPVTLVGFDTSTAATSACVLHTDGRAFEHVPPPERLREPPGHSRELLPLIAELMEQAGTTWADVDGIAVGVGPGTFTGLRIGVATARALATAAHVPVHPVSSLAALAEPIEAQRKLPLIDARRGELFGAL